MESFLLGENNLLIRAKSFAMSQTGFVSAVEKLFGPVGNELALFQHVAGMTGASVAAIKLLFTLLITIPIGMVYRSFIHELAMPKIMKQLLIALTGIFLCTLNYHVDIYHSLFVLFASYIMCSLLPAKHYILVTAMFVFHMGYLLLGYYSTETTNYDICWTMPQCVLVLRMIGLSFDICDGADPNTKKTAALPRRPGLVEMAAYMYFPATFLVGPQFPFRRFEDYMNGVYNDRAGYTSAGLKTFAKGVFYLSIHQLGTMLFPLSMITSQEYFDKPLVLRVLLLGVWGRLVMYKYISCWLLAESGATCFGISFNEKDPTKWDAVRNIRDVDYEFAESFGDYIKAFNVNTNWWVGEYIYKRLKFFGNKVISQVVTLVFLAIWHGFHTGYYVTFVMEFMIMNFEGNVCKIWNRNPEQWSPIVRLLRWCAIKFYTVVGMGWCLVPFVMLSWDSYYSTYKSVYFFGLLVIVPWHLVMKKISKQPPPIKTD